jgi:hypothetical protein
MDTPLPELPAVRNENMVYLSYKDINVEMFGSVITLYDKESKRRYSLNSPRAFKIYELISFYKAWDEVVGQKGCNSCFNLNLLVAGKKD